MKKGFKITQQQQKLIDTAFVKMCINFEKYTKENEKIFFELEDSLNDESVTIHALQLLSKDSTKYFQNIQKQLNLENKKDLCEFIITGRR